MKNINTFIFCLFLVATLVFKKALDEQRAVYEYALEKKDTYFSEYQHGMMYILAEKNKRKNR